MLATRQRGFPLTILADQDTTRPNPAGPPWRYLNAFETGSQARAGIGKWLAYYNAEAARSTHGILAPDEASERRTEPVRLAA